MIGKALLFWVVLAAIGVLNGVLRQLGYGPYMSAAAAHVVSCFTALVLIFAAVRGYVAWERERLTRRRAAWVGAFWVGLTILFEFGFGHWVIGHPWDRLLADYDLTAGRLWVLVLLGIGVAPWFWTRRLRAGVKGPAPADAGR